jgi:hypothetical protein
MAVSFSVVGEVNGMFLRAVTSPSPPSRDKSISE